MTPRKARLGYRPQELPTLKRAQLQELCVQLGFPENKHNAVLIKALTEQYRKLPKPQTDKKAWRHPSARWHGTARPRPVRSMPPDGRAPFTRPDAEAHTN